MKQVVDASVIIAYLRGEPGGSVLTSEDGPFCLSAVNLTEVLTKVIDLDLAAMDVMRVLKDLPIEHHDHTRDLAERASALRKATRSAGLSLGDRACLALAEQLRLTALTADHAWASLDVPVHVRLIR